MGGHNMAVLQLDPEGRIGQGLDDLTFHLNRVFFGHAALRGLTGREFCIKGAGNATRIRSGRLKGVRRRG
jgi:hypothetical protein